MEPADIMKRFSWFNRSTLRREVLLEMKVDRDAGQSFIDDPHIFDVTVDRINETSIVNQLL